MWDPREDSYIQDLAARIEALEEVADFEEANMLRRKISLIRQVVEWGQQPQDKLDRLIAEIEEDAQPTGICPAPPAPAGGLVKRVSHLLAKRFSESRPGSDCTPFARDVLREVAAWLRSDGPDWPSVASLLEQEANR